MIYQEKKSGGGALGRREGVVFMGRVGLLHIACSLDGRKRAIEKRARACRNARFKNTSVSKMVFQRRRDDNKNKICAFQGGGQGGREENCPKRYFSWKTPRQ